MMAAVCKHCDISQAGSDVMAVVYKHCDISQKVTM